MTPKYFLRGISSVCTKRLLVIHIHRPQQIPPVPPSITSLKVKWKHIYKGKSKQLALNTHLTYGKGKKKIQCICSAGTQELEQPLCKIPSGAFAFGGLCGLSDKGGSFKLRCTVNTHAHTGLYFLSDYHHPLTNEFGLIRSFYHRAGTVSNIEALTRKRERPLKSCGSP